MTMRPTDRRCPKAKSMKQQNRCSAFSRVLIRLSFSSSPKSVCLAISRYGAAENGGQDGMGLILSAMAGNEMARDGGSREKRGLGPGKWEETVEHKGGQQRSWRLEHYPEVAHTSCFPDIHPIESTSAKRRRALYKWRPRVLMEAFIGGCWILPIHMIMNIDLFGIRKWSTPATDMYATRKL